MTVHLALGHAAEIADSLGTMGKIEVKKFFGGAGLVLGGVYFGFIMKGTLYLRTDSETRPRFEALALAPFSYATRAGRITVASYYEAPAEARDDAQMLLVWARQAYAAALRTRRPAVARARRSKPAVA
ncbi:TfoX/Sxy family protein [Polaromonas sp.]|uniref:TfoX/Sxy family protein n=1 Tax=Polaromonas sp. TaxID=1869339 RepID=UPI003264A4A0